MNHTLSFLLIAGIAGLSLASMSACEVNDEGLYCSDDRQCEFLCSHAQECLGSSGGREIRISWTVNGLPPSPADDSACGAIENFEVRLETDGRRDALAYFPVPCNLGQVYYDRMPDRFRNLRILGKDLTGETIVIEDRTIESASATFTIDFRP